VRRKAFKALLWLVALPLLCVLITCGPSERPPAAPAPAPKELRPARIVSLSPSVTEILYGVGAWPQVVAVSQYCSYPPDVVNKPRVGSWADINLEQITALKPDLIIGADAQESIIGEKLNALGVRSLFVKSQSLTEVLDAIRAVGRAAGHADEASELARRTEREIETVRSTLAGRQRPRVLCIVGHDPGTLRDLYTATRGSFLDDLIGVAGGESVAPPAEQGYGKITKEAVLAFNPEVIIDIIPAAEGGDGANPTAPWRDLAEMRAVRDGRVYVLREPLVTHPSQFVGYTARAFANLIHPEAFPDEPGKPQ
jgi:iron complex transport system substrate-binding protein